MYRFLTDMYFDVKADMSRNMSVHKCENISIKDIRSYIKHFKGLGYKVTSMQCKFGFFTSDTINMIESKGMDKDMLTQSFVPCKLGIKYITIPVYNVKIQPKYKTVTHPMNNLIIHSFEDTITEVRLFIEPIGGR